MSELNAEQRDQLATLEEDLTHANAALSAHEALLAIVAPIMATDPDMTVEEAIPKLPPEEAAEACLLAALSIRTSA